VYLKNAFRIEANFYVIWDIRLKLTKLFMENRVGLQKLMIDTLHKSKASSLLLQCPTPIHVNNHKAPTRFLPAMSSNLGSGPA